MLSVLCMLLVFLIVVLFSARSLISCGRKKKRVIADALFVYYVCFIYDVVDTDMNDEWQMT